MLILNPVMTKPVPGQYPNNIRAIRESKGIKQAPVHQALGITQSAFSQLESGMTDLSVKAALIIAKVLKCEPHELSDGIKVLSTSGQLGAAKHRDIKRYVDLLVGGASINNTFPPEAKEMLAQHLSFVMDYDEKHGGIDGAQKYVDMAIAYLESIKHQLPSDRS